MGVENKVAIITGASRGIGKSIALCLASEGIHIVVNGTNEALLTELTEQVESNGGTCIKVAGDASLPETAEKLVEAALDRFGQIDILVNNAGINMRHSTLETTLEDWKKVIDINLTGTFLLSKAVLPAMIKQGAGKIINISSTASKTPHKNAAPSYGASKAGVNYLTMHLAQEMAKHNIHVNAVSPGPIETDMSKQWTPEYRETVVEKIPLKRIGHTKNVADVVRFLASDEADFITGQTINVNGGTFMN
ncbi:SDR family NAD(P)-dependent oxidoreductase [Alkalicoccobacillus porphyridii]|uniref:3-oxoacyl-ACP reductase FabG n=1 Tax=Alkalicoccobacillus porphyridii TaxID=2597270 RepID=A0A554A3Z3_9BACI|nr:3-oxoacyl-ACP reductase family protein [Alkalicoccobacillus porphyridii]TSB48398.1 3-oxoacyl-ACP reductase FabG [Alkalicoccobacillus porphyridii]